jgi:hypothetical protein
VLGQERLSFVACPDDLGGVLARAGFIRGIHKVYIKDINRTLRTASVILSFFQPLCIFNHTNASIETTLLLTHRTFEYRLSWEDPARVGEGD